MNFSIIFQFLIVSYLNNIILINSISSGAGFGVRLNNIKSFSTLFQSTRNDLNLDVASSIGLSPPWSTPRFLWTISRKVFYYLLPLCHHFDCCLAKNTCQNLSVIWWKAISGNRLGSTTFDGFMAYDMLPSISRLVVSFPLCWLYPNFLHHVVAIRTKFLDQIIENEICDGAKCDIKIVNIESKVEKCKVIVLGSGFDTRSLRLSALADWYEIDLPEVIQQKSCMLRRLLSRRADIKLPQLFKANISDASTIKEKLHTIFTSSDLSRKNNKNSITKCKTIFVLEAVLMYLDQSSTLSVLDNCIKTALPYSNNISICFADQLPEVSRSADKKFAHDIEKREAEKMFAKIGLKLTNWKLKAGFARHMGVAVHNK